MYKEDIHDLYIQKREAKVTILKEFLSIYLRMRLFFPNLEKERDQLVALVQLYFETDQNESEVLKQIKKYYGEVEDHEGIDELLEEFDTRFENFYDYLEDAFEDYESVLVDYWDFLFVLEKRLTSYFKGEKYTLGEENRYRMVLGPIRFPLFDEKYKQKLLVQIPHLPEPEEVDF